MARLSTLGEFIALDFETTGLLPGDDSIIDIGAVRIRNGEEVARYNTLVNPERAISEEISQLTGITNRELADAPVLATVRQEFRDFLGDLPIMAHNAKFEYAFLQQVYGTLYTPSMLDTYQVLSLMYPLSPSHSLEYFIRTFNLRSHELHRGLQDALDMLDVIRIVDEELDAPEFATLCSIVERRFGQVLDNPRRQWMWIPFFAGRHTTPTPALRNFRELYSTCEREPLPWELATAPSRLGEPEFFAAEYERYQIREQQQHMAEHAADTLRDGGVYLVEAGTGTGKTLAYSTAILSALATDNSAPVVVSTHTKALQNQFLEHEIPGLKRLFDVPQLRAVSLKGMRNYICVKKLEEVLPQSSSLFQEDIDLADNFSAAFIEYWLHQTSEGELDEFPRPMFELPVIQRTKAQARADFRDCTRRECGYYERCFYFKKEWEAASAHILAVNHSLLLSYPRTYPEFERLVVDEADELHAEARDAFSQTVSYTEARDAMEHTAGTHGSMRRLLQKLHRVVPHIEGEQNAVPEESKAAALSERWFAVLGRIDADMRLLNDAELFAFQAEITDERVAPAARERLFAEIENLRVLCSECAELAAAINDVVEKARISEDALPDLREMRLRLEDMDALERTLELFSKQDGKNYAMYIQVERDNWSFIVTPYDIGGLFAENVLSELHSCVLTSATASVTPDMRDFIENMGLDRTDKPVRTDRFASPFDYRSSSRVVFLKGMPRHNTDQFPEKAAEFIAEVAQKIGGRTLVLFTSKERLRRTHDVLISAVREYGIDVISHGVTNHSMGKCIDQFRHADRAILMGARGMWKGVDIPGDDLQCVIIEKMPYAVPHPYTKGLQNALVERYREEAFARGEEPDDRRLGAMAWNAVDKPMMFQSFRQMFGRLIRTETDKGVMVVLDAQLQGTGLSPRHRELMGLLPDVPYKVCFPNHALNEFDFLLPDPFEEMRKGLVS